MKLSSTSELRTISGRMFWQLLLSCIIVAVPACRPSGESEKQSAPAPKTTLAAPRKIQASTATNDQSVARKPERRESTKAQELLGEIGDEIRLLKQRMDGMTDQNWLVELADAQNTIGYIHIKLDQLNDAKVEAVDFKSWLYELEATLRSTGENNWQQKAIAARHVLANLDIELASLKADQSK